MFVNQGVAGSQRHDELFLYLAERPEGPWRLHPQAPIKSDVRGARPAGRPFRWRGQLYRPAQDCSERYGGELVFQRVLELTPTSYREVEASRAGPRWRPGLLATHTFNHCPGLTVVDALRLRPRLELGGSP